MAWMREHPEAGAVGCRLEDGAVASAADLRQLPHDVVGFSDALQAKNRELKDFLIGPNASRVTRHADCSVLVVRD